MGETYVVRIEVPAFAFGLKVLERSVRLVAFDPALGVLLSGRTVPRLKRHLLSAPPTTLLLFLVQFVA
jgi:hypothetical protein